MNDRKRSFKNIRVLSIIKLQHLKFSNIPIISNSEVAIKKKQREPNECYLKRNSFKILK